VGEGVGEVCSTCKWGTHGFGGGLGLTVLVE